MSAEDLDPARSRARSGEEHCQMAFFPTSQFRLDCAPLSIPCRWAVSVVLERQKSRLKGNRQSKPVDLAVRPETRSSSLNDFGEEFTTRLRHLCCRSDARFCAAIYALLEHSDKTGN